MGYNEYLLWCKYRNKYGPLNPVRLYDRSGAIIASQVNNAHGGKAKVEDFIVYGRDPEEEIDISEYIKAAFGGKVKIGKRKRR
jgi:hypothetical protein